MQKAFLKPVNAEATEGIASTGLNDRGKKSQLSVSMESRRQKP